MNSSLLTSKQAEERLTLTCAQLTRMRNARKIGFVKRGGRYFYSTDEVQRVLSAMEVPALVPVIPMLQDGGAGHAA